MILETYSAFKDFQLLDSGDGQRLEQWSEYRLIRPDPQAVWQKSLPDLEWQKANAQYITDDDKGNWSKYKDIPESWLVAWNDTKLVAKLSPFKHTGIFAEQAANWEWLLVKTANKNKPLRILNLFGYTGCASIILAKAGHKVTHVDASKPAIAWAKENQQANNLKNDSIRWIIDDATDFVRRENKRGNLYDGIIMDPPAFGHGPTGKIWKFNRDLPTLLQLSMGLFSNEACFLLINGYATNASALSLYNITEDALKLTQFKGKLSFGELCLKQKNNRLISTGIFSRWHSLN